MRLVATTPRRRVIGDFETVAEVEAAILTIGHGVSFELSRLFGTDADFVWIELGELDAALARLKDLDDA